MMKAVVNVTKPKKIKTSVSLNPIMIDGTGMCGCCRVSVDGKIKFACVDGPDFDGLQVDFDEFDSDAYDAICEFINCTNGMFATKLSDQEIEVVLRPPVFYGDASISGDNGFYVVTMEIDGTEFNVIMSVSDKVRLKTIKTNCV